MSWLTIRNKVLAEQEVEQHSQPRVATAGRRLSATIRTLRTSELANAHILVGGDGGEAKMRVRRAMTAAGCAAVVALAPACGNSPAKEPDGRAHRVRTLLGHPSEASGEPETPVADPEHAVDPPGPVQTPLEQADVLIVDPEEQISDELAGRIEKLDGVTEVTKLGIVQVSIENKIYNVAVVDPAEYRRFTEDVSATLQDQWDRVAGGEMAVARGLKDRLPIDDEGYLRLGSGEDDARRARRRLRPADPDRRPGRQRRMGRGARGDRPQRAAGLRLATAPPRR